MYRDNSSAVRSPRRVALVVASSQAYGQGVLRGVARWLRSHGPWLTHVEQRSLHDGAPPWLAGWEGDGIIIHAASPQVARLVGKLKLPTVDVFDEERGLPWPAVRNDNVAIGRLAAQHFIERGLRHFAFCGLRGNQWSDGRLRGFEQALAAARLDCHVFRQTERFSWGFWLRSPERELVALVDWLKNLPRPLGLFACNDERGMLLLSACRQAGLVVPRDVAVLGVDNDEVVCQLAAPELSSVVADSAGIGFEAARLLDRLMTERSAESGVHLVGPQGIVARQSTDLAAAWDRDVAAAIEFIRQNAAGALAIETVVEAAGVSRSLLQQKFRAQLGRTIHDVIVEHRVARIKHLLETSDLTLTAIARRTGYVHVEYLSTVFKRQTGMSPGEYRRQFHGRAVR